MAIDAGKYAVRPSRLSTLSLRHNVVDRGLFADWLHSAVLSGYPVALESVSAVEGNRLRRIELHLSDNLWDSDAKANEWIKPIFIARYFAVNLCG